MTIGYVTPLARLSGRKEKTLITKIYATDTSGARHLFERETAHTEDVDNAVAALIDQGYTRVKALITIEVTLTLHDERHVHEYWYVSHYGELRKRWRAYAKRKDVKEVSMVLVAMPPFSRWDRIAAKLPKRNAVIAAAINFALTFPLLLFVGSSVLVSLLISLVATVAVLFFPAKKNIFALSTKEAQALGEQVHDA